MVNSTADAPDANPGDGVCATSGGVCTLRAAVDETNATAGMDTVTVPAGTYDVDNRIVIMDSLHLNGAGASSTILDGGGDASLLHVQSAEYLVCDSSNDRVWSYDVNGQRNGSFVSAGSGGLDVPLAATIGPENDLYVAGFSSGIHRYDGDTGASKGVLIAPGSGGLVSPSDVAFGPSSLGTLSTDEVYVADFNNPPKGILRYKSNEAPATFGDPLGTFVAPGVGGLGNPNTLVFRNGDLYATSTVSDSVLRFNGETGALISTFVPSFSGGLDTPRGLLFAPDGSLLVASWENDRVLRYNGTTGAFLGEFISAGSGGLDRPTDLVVGHDGSLLVASQGTQQILRYDMNTGGFRGVLIDSASDTLLGQPSCIVPRKGLGDGPVVNINGITLRNGYNTVTGDAGAGLRVDDGSSVALNDSVVRDNDSSTFGGGISNWGILDINRSEIRNNRLPEGGGGQTSQGGGIFNVGVLDIEDSAITENFATRGGGISNTNQGVVSIRNSTVSSNRAFGGGGGIRNVADGRVNIASSTVTKNRANEPGGEGEGNRYGGGIMSLDPARVSIGGTILAGNTDNRSTFDADYAPDCYAPTMFHFTSERGNLVGVLNENCAMRDVIYGDTSFDKVGTEASPLDPKLGVLTNNGGPNRTHSLLIGSPAIDGKTSGTSSTYFNCRDHDQRGNSRPTDGDGNGTATCDIGAFERDGVAAPPKPLYTANLHVNTSGWFPFAKVNYSAEGFRPGESVVTTFGATQVSAVADGAGKISGLLIAPNTPNQVVPIVSQGQDTGVTATFGFYVGAFHSWGSPSQWYVHPGNTITFNGNAFAPDETVNVEVNGVIVSSASADASGNFNNEGSYTVPNPFAAGSFGVVLRGVTSGATASFNVSVGP